ncbi:hypothetical protein M378DRAFT_178037 [Amanita muscaria Koide BX008]|uniref:Hydrophobin n=1 Tax=Amanita muscaria (strain Koide BX008) TaxID=946122 RepID=A0A0C2SS39_AMAMK|nr:hypothetical protein M378DRAFT_178037 [Amanita muscaria Koide BX008]
MRLTAVFAIFTAVAATSVAAHQTNAERLARGLPPNPPARRGASNTDSAEHHHPSGKPHHKHHGDGGDDKGDDGHDSYETNAQRLARGLPPNPPVRRGASNTDSAEHHHPSGKPHGDGDDSYDGTHVRRDASGTDSAEHHHPSGKPHKGHGGGDDDDKCKTGAIQCCNSVSNSANPVVKTIAGLVKAKLPTDNIPIGLGCSAIGEHSCSAKTVCCENNDYSGLIAIGCISIKISA